MHGIVTYILKLAHNYLRDGRENTCIQLTGRKLFFLKASDIGRGGAEARSPGDGVGVACTSKLGIIGEAIKVSSPSSSSWFELCLRVGVGVR